jgi:hypothetical protein
VIQGEVNLVTADSWDLSLQDGFSASGMTYHELWLRQVAAGGNASLREVIADVGGLREPDAHHHNILAQAINEYFVERGGNHPVAYRDRSPQW